MQKIFTPENEIELIMVKGLLEAAQIPFYVQNDHFGGLYIGPQIQHFNQRAIMVAPEYAVRSKEIIAEFIATQQQVKPESSAQVERSPLLEKLRLLGEALLFCWIVPRKHRRKPSDAERAAESDERTECADHNDSNGLNTPKSEHKKCMED
jgi:hypothetical protein